jgi:hypothetical protein
MFAQSAAISWAESQWAPVCIGHCRYEPAGVNPTVDACLRRRRSAQRDAGENRMPHAACGLLEGACSASRGRPSSRSSLLLFLMISPSSWSAVPSSVNGT